MVVWVGWWVWVFVDWVDFVVLVLVDGGGVVV